jgi:3-oxoacyl-[acyl-carrier protein] reductase
MLLKGKTAIITGAGRGIGTSVARLFAAEGASVVVHYNHSKVDAEALAAELGRGSFAFSADLTSPEAAQGLAEMSKARLGRIDILVNCAASFASNITEETAVWSDFQKEFDGVVGATVNPVHAVVPAMKAQGYGRIVNFIATLVQRPSPEYLVHITAKSALIGYSRTIARDLGPHGITVNMISPGVTLTEFSKSLSDDVRTKIQNNTPLRRLAEPDDVAGVALFYASDLAHFVTGANIAPDGGLTVL